MADITLVSGIIDVLSGTLELVGFGEVGKLLSKGDEVYSSTQKIYNDFYTPQLEIVDETYSMLSEYKKQYNIYDGSQELEDLISYATLLADNTNNDPTKLLYDILKLMQSGAFKTPQDALEFDASLRTFLKIQELDYGEIDEYTLKIVDAMGDGDITGGELSAIFGNDIKTMDAVGERFFGVKGDEDVDIGSLEISANSGAINFVDSINKSYGSTNSLADSINEDPNVIKDNKEKITTLVNRPVNLHNDGPFLNGSAYGEWDTDLLNENAKTSYNGHFATTPYF